MAYKSQIYYPTDDLDAKMWRQYRHALVCLENDNLARYDILGNRILMKLSYEQWKELWINSGVYHLRGRTAGTYQMCRHNDIGHYEYGNVSIMPIAKNQNTAHFGRKASQYTKDLMSAARRKEKHPLWGKKHSQKTIEKMSISAKNRKRNITENEKCQIV